MRHCASMDASGAFGAPRVFCRVRRVARSDVPSLFTAASPAMSFLAARTLQVALNSHTPRVKLLTRVCGTCWETVDTGKLEVGFSPEVLRQIAEAEAARGGKSGESAEKAVGEISRQMVCSTCSVSVTW